MTNKIYLACFATGTGSGMVNGSTKGGDVTGYALAEDGICIASHLSSNVYFSKHDLGLTSNWNHENYDKHYPKGYELIWVEQPEDDSRWQAAMVLNQKLKELEESEKGN